MLGGGRSYLSDGYQIEAKIVFFSLLFFDFFFLDFLFLFFDDILFSLLELQPFTSLS